MNEFSIKNCKIIIEWNDGEIENLGPDLPQYLAEEIENYLEELQELRNERPEEYNFSEMGNL